MPKILAAIPPDLLQTLPLLLLTVAETAHVQFPPSHSPLTDTELGQLNASLLKEEEGLVANRGLVSQYQADPQLNESQTFLVFLSQELRAQYDATLLKKIAQVG